MKRLLVLACVAVAVLAALRRPAPAPAISSAGSPLPPPVKTAASQHSRKGHPFVANSSASIVYVVGAVLHPGLYRLQAGARINDAIERAGGLRADADPAAVNLAERVSDGEEIHVLRTGETARPQRRSTRKTSSPPPARSIDVNDADAQALASIPGIGPTLASRIVTYRRLNGPFASLDELADVAGMTQRRIDAMAAYVTINNPQNSPQ